MEQTDNSFTSNGIQPLCDSLRVNATLSSLILKSLYSSVLSRFIVFHSTILVFWFLSDNDIGDIGTVKLCDALKVTKSLTVLDLSRIGLHNVSSFTKMFLMLLVNVEQIVELERLVQQRCVMLSK